MIINGKSMGINSKKHKFYSSSIVGGCLPVALGTALAIKLRKKKVKFGVLLGI